MTDQFETKAEELELATEELELVTGGRKAGGDPLPYVSTPDGLIALL